MSLYYVILQGHCSAVGSGDVTWVTARALWPSSWWPSQPFGQQQLLRTGKCPSNFKHFPPLSHVVTLCHPLKKSEKVHGSQVGSEWKQGTFIRFHTLSWLQKGGWRKIKLLYAAVPGCAQPTYEHDGWLGARTAHCTVLAESRWNGHVLGFSSGFCATLKDTQSLLNISISISISPHPSLSCRFAWRPLKPYEIATFFESLQGDFGTQGASGSVPQPGMGWRCAELFFLACWKLSPAVSLAVTCQTSIREPTWLDPLSNLHRHSTLQGRMCVVASRTVLVFWALLVQIVFSFWHRMDAEWLRMTQIPGTSSFQICQVNCQDVNQPIPIIPFFCDLSCQGAERTFSALLPWSCLPKPLFGWVSRNLIILRCRNVYIELWCRFNDDWAKNHGCSWIMNHHPLSNLHPSSSIFIMLMTFHDQGLRPGSKTTPGYCAGGRVATQDSTDKLHIVTLSHRKSSDSGFQSFSSLYVHCPTFI